MKTNAIIRIVLFTLGILILGSILFACIGFRLFTFDGIYQMETHSDQTLMDEAYVADPAQIKSIHIQWAAGDISIEPNDSLEYIQVSESECDEEYRMVCKESGSTLTIQFCKSSKNFISFGTNIDSKKLVIKVPASWICQTLEIEAASADVEVSNMTIEKLDFDSASGWCNIKNCTVTDMDVDAASGDLYFSGVLDTLEFDGASADCNLILSKCPSHIDLDGMSGNLDVTLPADCGFTVTTEGVSSSFGTDFQTISRNGSHIHGDGQCKIEVNAMSGNAFIHNGGENCHDGHEGHHSSHH
jgi:DUF4097 and DUF4098 domain-containing protein YvlB